ncbi:Uu.00g031410.m01.CDS01 [Anthostomella pinea]|uniref:Uu.00g031410.m01.CDS01 n=1 Tax=Anthostomella pinea TaxID=933095 RepID=A0AAI8V3L7_9PEZI|nr:Uu.00g031410.m01.CDS01 [Anthostomella pinea]
MADYTRAWAPSLLHRTLGYVQQQSWHIRPDIPSIQGGLGREQELFPGLHAPLGFVLSNVFAMPKGESQRDGYIYRICVRLSTGDDIYGIERSDPLGAFLFEISKFLAWRYPVMDRSNVPNRFDQPTTVYDREVDCYMLEMDHYPDVRKCIMKGRFQLIPGRLNLAPAKQPTALTMVFGIPELFEKITAGLFTRSEDLNNLFRACQFAACTIRDFLTHVDMAHGDYLGMDRAVDHELPKVVTPHVVFGPIRDAAKPRNRSIDRHNEYRYPVLSSALPWVRESEVYRLGRHMTMVKSIWLCGSSLKSVMFTNCPYLDMKILPELLKSMPRLEALAIHSCPLMHLGTTADLMELVGGLNQLKKGEAVSIKLDHTPWFFKGPRPGVTELKRTYGVLPQDEGKIEIKSAVAAYLVRIWRQCEKFDMNFFAVGTAFRAYLERVPFELATLPCILKAIVNLKDLEKGRFGQVNAETHTAMHKTLLFDLLVAVEGKSMELPDLEKLLCIRGRIVLMECIECHESLPASFYTKQMAERRPEYRLCKGCQMVDYLDRHCWDFNEFRVELAQQILTLEPLPGQGTRRFDGRVNCTLEEFLSCDSWEAKQRLQRLIGLAEGIDNRIPGEIKRALQRQQEKLDELNKEFVKDKANRKAAEKVANTIARKRSQLGEEQIGSRGFTDRQSWEAKAKWYNTMLAVDHGSLGNLASRPGFNSDEHAVDIVGRGIPAFDFDDKQNW